MDQIPSILKCDPQQTSGRPPSLPEVQCHAKESFGIAAGETWWRGFKRRHPEVTVKAANKLTSHRVRGIALYKIERWCALKTVYHVFFSLESMVLG